jgi:hypothetical protein
MYRKLLVNVLGLGGALILAYMGHNALSNGVSFFWALVAGVMAGGVYKLAGKKTFYNHTQDILKFLHTVVLSGKSLDDALMEDISLLNYMKLLPTLLYVKQQMEKHNIE